MKKLLFLAFAAVSALFVSCQDTVIDDGSRLDEVKLDPSSAEMKIGENLTLSVEIVPPTAHADLYWSSSDESVAAVSEQGVVTAVAEGEAVITLNAAMPDRNQEKTATCAVRVVDETEVGDFSIELMAEGIHATSVDALRAIPSDNEQTYYYCLIEASRFEEEGGKDGIHDFDITWWSFLAESFGTTWQQEMQAYLSKGKAEVPSSKYIDPMSPETEYVLYGYGLTREGQKTTDVFTTSFTTGKPERSDNVIEVSIVDITNESVIVDVETTNNDTYFLITQPKTYWDKYKDDMEYLASNLAETYIGLGIYDFFFNGPQKGLEIPSDADTDYYVIAFGYEDGVTTDVIGIPFHTDPL